jgi:hypothetical protein
MYFIIIFNELTSANRRGTALASIRPGAFFAPLTLSPKNFQEFHQ